MEVKTKKRTISVDGDAIVIQFRLDELWNVWLGDYPFFKEEPRYTPSGRPWRNVSHTDCPMAKGKWGDCGSCPYFIREHPMDMIGVCFYDERRQKQGDPA